MTPPRTAVYRLDAHGAFHHEAALAMLAAHAIPGAEQLEGARYRRVLALSDGPAEVCSSREGFPWKQPTESFMRYRTGWPCAAAEPQKTNPSAMPATSGPDSMTAIYKQV